jgi:hypothetical protein
MNAATWRTVLRWITIGVAAQTSAMLIACGAVPGGTTSPEPALTPGGHLTMAGDADNGKTVNLRVGDRLVIRLESTYWTFAGSDNPQVLKALGQVDVSPQPSGCVPGGGCGTVTATYDVVGAGSAAVTASRTSCGEAMGCSAAEGSYRLTVLASA